jgi:hypothetical protein
MVLPMHYYHYTSIERLALILNNRTIRFSRTDFVNDLEEINVLDRPEIKTSVFISCWSSDKNESIPMWNLYGNNLRGIRIKLKSPIFEGSSAPSEVKDHECNIMVLKNLKNFIGRENDYEWVKYLFGPIQVEYRSDTKVLVNGSDNSLIVKNIGTIKPNHWGFEKEYRFLALANHVWNSSSNSFEIKKAPYYSEVVSKFIDIQIDEEIFDEIEVLLGPSCTEAEHIIVESLLNKYTKNGVILKSKLKDKIKT